MLADPLGGISGQTRAMLEPMTGGRLPVMEPDDVRELADGVPLELAGLELVVDHAPGHTRGSVMFRSAGTGDVPPVLLSGDVLFEGSIGRTDLPGGDHQQMLRSLTDQGAAARGRDGRAARARRHDVDRTRAGGQPVPARAGPRRRGRAHDLEGTHR